MYASDGSRCLFRLAVEETHSNDAARSSGSPDLFRSVRRRYRHWSRVPRWRRWLWGTSLSRLRNSRRRHRIELLIRRCLVGATTYLGIRGRVRYPPLLESAVRERQPQVSQLVGAHSRRDPRPHAKKCGETTQQVAWQSHHDGEDDGINGALGNQLLFLVDQADYQDVVGKESAEQERSDCLSYVLPRPA